MNPIHRFMLFFSLLLFPISLFAEKGSGEENVKVVDFAGLEPYLKKSNDTIYVVNFWATWCAPCIKEIPYFSGVGSCCRPNRLLLALRLLPFH